MSIEVTRALTQHAKDKPADIALRGTGTCITYKALADEVESLSSALKTMGSRVVALYADNHPAWVVVDLACMKAGLTCVPIPLFFSKDQRDYAIRNADVDTVLTPHPDAFPDDEHTENALVIAGLTLHRMSRAVRARRDMTGICKVTYTSGTTGQSKGVKFTHTAIDNIVKSASKALEACASDRFLAVVPLSVLMENVLGLYVSLVAGAEYTAISMMDIGFLGSNRMDVATTFNVLRQNATTNAICTPQMVNNLVAHLEKTKESLPALRFVGVGGAPISQQLLERGAAVGLPLYQGWGLSEVGTVVTLNVPTQNRVGSVGKPLPHTRIRRMDDGEIVVQTTSLFAGYVGDPTQLDPTAWYSTGDLGAIDEDGYLTITGRKKTVIINSYGRNISPEWIESELTTRTEIAQAAVFGDSRPYLVAVVVPNRETSPAEIDRALNEVNSGLPDYGQVRRWVVAEAPFSVENDQFSVVGKPRRDVIARDYRAQLDALYGAHDAQ